jgi:hypothetical protein
LGALTFRSTTELLQVDPVATYTSSDFSTWRFDVNKYFMGFDCGYGVRSAAFNWSTGEMDVSSYSMDNLQGKKFGIKKEFVDDLNVYLMLPSYVSDTEIQSESSNFLPPNSYNKAFRENWVVRKNTFNVSLVAIVPGNFILSPLDKVKVYHVWYDQSIDDNYVANDYLIYRAKHMFAKTGYTTELTMFARSYKLKSDKYII